MVSSGADGSTVPRRPAGWDRLELGVRRLLDDHAAWRQRALAAEARVRELEAQLAEVSAGRLDPAALGAEVERLDSQNRALLERLERARGSVYAIMNRLQLLEEDR